MFLSGVNAKLFLVTVILNKAVKSVNIALGNPAYQSSVARGGDPGNAVDGNFNGNLAQGSCIRTLHGETEQWWVVDLQNFYTITDVWIQNRNKFENLHDFAVDVFPQNPVENGAMDKRTCYNYSGVAPNENVHLTCQNGTVGRYVRLLKLPELITDSNDDVLVICEVVIEGSISDRPCGGGQSMDSTGQFMAENVPVSVKTIPGSIDSSMTSSNQIVQGLTRVQCLHLCYNNYNCQGFNARKTDGSCQIITESNQPILENPGWTFFPIN